MIEALARDLRFAARQLIKSPGFAVTAILTLALGIGANTAMFSVVEGVLLSPLPYPQPDRLVTVWQTRPNVQHIDISYGDFGDWQRNSRSFERIAAYMWTRYSLAGQGAPENIEGMKVASGFFATLGVKLALGREIAPAEDRNGAAPVAVISDRLWNARFDSSPNVIGQSVDLDGVNYTIVGVAPRGFRFWIDSDVYASIARGAPQILLQRSVHGIGGIARLRPGVSLAQAQEELSAVQQNLDRLYPADERNIGIDLVPLKQQMVGDIRPTLLLLLCAVGLVLVIACANIANLLMARSAGRMRELGVRSALGATRSRIVRQLLTESVILSFAGAVPGAILAKASVGAVRHFMKDAIPRSDNISVNLPVLLFTFGVVVLVGILFGIVPALKSSKLDLQAALKEGGRGATGTRHGAQSTLVVVQMALTLVLLAGSGLLLRTIRDLLSQNPGFDAQHLVAFRIGLAPTLPRAAAATRTALQQTVERIRDIPGVESATLTNLVPLDGSDNSGPFWPGTQAPASLQDAPHALYFWSSPEYIATMKISLLQGRFFTAADNVRSDHVVAIDEDLARAYFPGRSPVGETLTVGHWGAARIVGVVAHVRHWGLADPTSYNPGQIYISVYQLPDWMALDFFRDSLTIVARSAIKDSSLVPAIREAVNASGGGETIFNVQPMEQIISSSMAAQRLPMMLLGAFAALALVLASVGIYGVVSYSVAQRVQEIGIRMALGASRRDVLAMVIGNGLRMTVAGMAIGLVAAFALARILASFTRLLYGVRASDPLTLAAVSLLLAATALLACAFPARRAASIDPSRALRSE
jgi:predicted permease